VSKWCDVYSDEVVEKLFEYEGCVDDEEEDDGDEKTRAGRGCGEGGGGACELTYDAAEGGGGDDVQDDDEVDHAEVLSRMKVRSGRADDRAGGGRRARILVLLVADDAKLRVPACTRPSILLDVDATFILGPV
jgi:sirohydrochlorin ferrochelatase